MLQSLHVKNLALIDEIEVEFAEGLNILTGETGAGKSIILGSVNLALGGRYTKDLIRQGENYALVELVFTVTEKSRLKALEKLCIYPEDGLLILSRKLMDGRSVSRINGETVTIAVLKEVAAILIDIHGQHEHQSLLYKKNHLGFVDAFAWDYLADIKKQAASAYQEYRTCKKTLDEADMDESSRAKELDFLKFEVSEILNAYFGEGKWDENLITSQESLASERNEYDGENRKLWIVQTGVGFLSITITYKDEVPDEKVRLQEGEDLLQTLNINIMDEYMKQTDFVNDDRSVYTYYLQQDGIKISPEGYSIGSEGDETEYYGQFAKISMEDNGYMIMIQKASEVVGRESISERQQISDEDAIQAVYDAVWNGLQIPALQTNPIADSLQVEVQYIPVDMGSNTGEYVYDIGFYVKQLIDQDGSDALWHFTGLVDATMPYCYSFTMARESDEEFQTEYLKISDRKK